MSLWAYSPLDGVYTLEQGRPRFRRVPPPTTAELEALLQVITARVARHLERRGLLVRDTESSHLTRVPGGKRTQVRMLSPRPSIQISLFNRVPQ